MKGYESATWGDRIADVYDTWFATPADTPEAVDFLMSMHSGGPVLEVGAGTGRLVVPLRARGADVHAIEVSGAMIERLRAKDTEIPVSQCALADVDAPGVYQLVFTTCLVLLNPTDQERCFRNVASRLQPDGAFVVQAAIHNPARFAFGQATETMRVTADECVLFASRLGSVCPWHIERQQILITEAGVRLYPVEVFLTPPDELDRMAGKAGLRLAARYGGWKQQPFGERNTWHISVYDRSD